jgi:hypothetical protein
VDPPKKSQEPEGEGGVGPERSLGTWGVCGRSTQVIYGSGKVSGGGPWKGHGPRPSSMDLDRLRGGWND